jgi:hypothetical protein
MLKKREQKMGSLGSKNSPVHMGGGLKVENLDAFSMTIVALVLGLIRLIEITLYVLYESQNVFLLLCRSLIIAVAALIIALIALVRISNRQQRFRPPLESFSRSPHGDSSAAASSGNAQSAKKDD